MNVDMENTEKYILSIFIYLFSTWYDAKSAKCVLDRNFMQYF